MIETQRIQQRVLLLGQHFVGRDWLATAVEDEINKVNGLKTTNEKNENAVSCNTTSSQTVVVVYGDSGTGKSAFFSRILDSSFCRDKFCHDKKKSWLNLHNQVLARHICRVQDDDSLDPLKWVRSLAGQIFIIFSQVGQLKKALKIGNHGQIILYTTYQMAWKLKSIAITFNPCLILIHPKCLVYIQMQI